MKPEIKGALLSGLVFPGVGQLVLGQKAAGLGFIVFTCLGIVGLTYSITQRISLIVAQLVPQMENGTLTLPEIMAKTQGMSSIGGTLLEQAIIWLIVACWLLSIIHAYFSGKKQPERSTFTD